MGKQLLFDALQGKKTTRPAWMPFVGCHGAMLIEKAADEYFRSSELIAQGIREAIARYRPDGIPALFDLQLEAEALDCEVQWAQDAPPTVVDHVLNHASLHELRLPDETTGRIPEVLAAMRQLRAEAHDVALYGLITGPFTLALHLKGTNMFIEMYDKPAEAHELLHFCAEVAKTMTRLYIDAGCDVIASVDPMTSQISPRAFQTFVAPYATDLFQDIRRCGAFSSFFVCGHAQKNVEVMCQCQPDNVSVDENIPLDFVRGVSRRYGVSFGGNLQLTVILLMGNEEDARRHALETIELGGDCGFILARDLPFHVPPENLMAVADVVHHLPNQRRGKIQDVPGSMPPHEAECDDPGCASKLVIEIVTLDFEASAPSRYGIEIVREAAASFGDRIIWREHRIEEQETMDFMLRLMVKNVPIICLDGEIVFVGTLPSRSELVRAIRKRLDKRLLTYT